MLLAVAAQEKAIRSSAHIRSHVNNEGNNDCDDPKSIPIGRFMQFDPLQHEMSAPREPIWMHSIVWGIAGTDLRISLKPGTTRLPWLVYWTAKSENLTPPPSPSPYWHFHFLPLFWQEKGFLLFFIWWKERRRKCGNLRDQRQRVLYDILIRICNKYEHSTGFYLAKFRAFPYNASLSKIFPCC